MSDIEMTKLCAEAMGLEIGITPSPDEYVTAETLSGMVWINNRFGVGVYDPLEEDEQAMALAKRFMMKLDFFAGAASMPNFSSTDDPGIAFSDESMNRAIVECVAKMQAAKVAA
jgi:hypothetical protein